MIQRSKIRSDFEPETAPTIPISEQLPVNKLGSISHFRKGRKLSHKLFTAPQLVHTHAHINNIIQYMSYEIPVDGIPQKCENLIDGMRGNAYPATPLKKETPLHVLGSPLERGLTQRARETARRVMS